MRPTTKFQLTAAAFGLALGAALVSVPGPARAADDGEWVDTKILRSILEGIGLRKDGEAGINYQQRAPLVIPQRLELPAPEKADAATNNPAWPKDPDVARRKEEERLARSRNISAERELEQNPLRPDQITPGAKGDPRRASRDDGYRPPASGFGSQLSPSALGYKGGLFGNMFGGKEDEVAKFTGEPARTQLTDPPPGYQTPSPDQPYGLSKGTLTQKPEVGKYYEDHVTAK